MKHVKNFCLIWNIFEAFACSKRANIGSIKKVVDKIDEEEIRSELIADYINYFFVSLQDFSSEP